jgi:dipeptidyl aminopeptidase/acylaminoacyl peptidase
MTVVSFGSDGLTEYALMATPPTLAPDDGYPVVILAHGYINPTAYQTAGSDYASFIGGFCQAGYVVLKPDYRGNGSSQGSPTVGDIEPGYTYDLLNLTASLKNLTGVNAGRVAWLGHSMGGQVVLRAAVADHSLPVKAVVLASGVVGSLPDIIVGWPPAMLPADLVPVRAEFVKAHGMPNDNPQFYHDVSAINYVAAIHAPVEITYGTADEIVPTSFSQHLDAALTASGKPHLTHAYAGGDHQYSAAGSGLAFIQDTLVFLNQNLK